MVNGGLVAVVLSVALLGAGCGGGNGGTGNGGQGVGGIGGSAPGGIGGSAPGVAGSYGWVPHDGTAYTINAIWGDRANSVWAVTMGGQLLFYDGATWDFVFGGAMPALYTVWGLPGQSDIYFAGVGRQFYLVRGVDVFDLGINAGSENRAVWAARADQVWLGFESAYGGLVRYDLTTTVPSSTIEGPSDLAGVRAIWGPSADETWVIDDAGELIHRVNQTWTRVSTIQNPRLTAIHGTSSRDVWAVGPYALLHWDGSFWTEMGEGRNAGFLAVWAAGPSSAWVVGEIGWTAHVTPTRMQGVPSGTTRTLYTVWGTSPTDIWTGGLDGVLLHYEPVTGGGQPDGGGACIERGEQCGPGECCAPWNCARIADVGICG